MTTNTPTPRWTGRTRFVTAASIVAVGIAGAMAIGANIGILDAAGSNDVGQLSAADDLTDTTEVLEPQIVEVYLNSDGTTTITEATRDGAAPIEASQGEAIAEPTAASGSESFAVDAAGTVTIARTTDGLRLEAVSPNAGWTWQLSQSDPSSLTVSFTDGTRVLDFTATLGADGTITPEVVETVIEPAGSSNSSYGGDDDDEEHEDEDEHEGSEDDD